MESFEDPNKTTIYNYYHDYFTAKQDVLYYPKISDFIKVKTLRPKLIWDENSEHKTGSPPPWLAFDPVDVYAETNGGYAVRHDFKSIRNELKYVTESENKIYE